MPVSDPCSLTLWSETIDAILTLTGKSMSSSTNAAIGYSSFDTVAVLPGGNCQQSSMFISCA